MSKPIVTRRGFSPRIEPRPAYPSLRKVVYHTVKSYARDVLHGYCLLAALAPLYDAAITALRETHGLSDRACFSLGLSASHTLAYAVVCGFFYVVEARGWLRAYKIARKTMHTANNEKLDPQAFTEAAVGQFVVGPLVGLAVYHAFTHFGMPPLAADATAYWRSAEGAAACARAVVVGHLFNDVAFYWSHRTAHTPWIYSWVHKQHHSYAATVAHAAEFAGPVETVLSNQLPTVGGIMFFGRRYEVLLVWLVLRLKQTYEVHSGFCFAKVRGGLLDALMLSNGEETAQHDYHHTHNSGCFGALWLDWLFGTMDGYCELGGDWQGYCAKMQRDADAEAAKMAAAKKQ